MPISSLPSAGTGYRLRRHPRPRYAAKQAAQRARRAAKAYGAAGSKVAARTPAATPSFAAKATSVRVTPRWQGSGPAHWHHGTVHQHRVTPAPAQLSQQQVRSRGMYGY